MADQGALLLKKQLRGISHAFTSCLPFEQSSKVNYNSRTSAELLRRPVDGFSAGLVDDSNIYEWQVTIMGPPDTF